MANGNESSAKIRSNKKVWMFTAQSIGFARTAPTLKALKKHASAVMPAMIVATVKAFPCVLTEQPKQSAMLFTTAERKILNKYVVA